MISQTKNEIPIMTKREVEQVLEIVSTKLNIKPAHRELLKTLVSFSDAGERFEISYRELGGLLFGDSNTLQKRNSEKAKYALESFFKWQRDNGVQIIRLRKKGNRFRNKDGQFVWKKSKYSFVFISKLKEVRYTSEMRFGELANEVISQITNVRWGVKPKKEQHPNHKIKKAKNTILTFFRNIYKLAIKAEKDALMECQKILTMAKREVLKVDKLHRREENRQRLLKKFDETLGS